MSLPSSASQPFTPTASCAVPQFPQASSSQGALPSSHPRLYDTTNVLDLNLPPNALKILAQSQASGRLPPLFDCPTGQPIRTAKSVAVTKRTTARSHSRPNTLKSGTVSAYPQGLPASSLVPRPCEGAQGLPPPAKIRARLSAKAAKSKAKESTRAVTQGPDNTIPSRSDRAQSASQLPFIFSSIAQAASSRAESLLPITYTGPPAAALSSTAWGEQGKNMSMPTLQPDPWVSATAKKISERFGFDGLPLSLIEQLLPGVMDVWESPSVPLAATLG
jgi:hypothetical protein